MAKKTKTTKKVLNEESKATINRYYRDFKGTLDEGLGDVGKVIKTHKLLAVVAFLLFLWHRNKEASIGSFISKFEERMKGKEFDD